ncbi:MAG: polysaccharide biosynthesis/export family protein [Alphaproteobacteria bacterium]
MLALAFSWVIGGVTASAPASAQEYRLGSQDRIAVTVFGETDLSGEFELDGEGKVALPLLGEIALGGMTLREAERIVAARLHPDYLIDPKVSIQVANYRPFYILGEVKSPGGYPYVNGMTVVQAVALAGGFTYRARTSNVVIVRDASRQPASQSTAVMPGDIIEVPERFF